MMDVGLQKGDIILLCSDGLTTMVSDRQIYDIVMECNTPEEAAIRLKDTANENGGTDNISVILIKID